MLIGCLLQKPALTIDAGFCFFSFLVKKPSTISYVFVGLKFFGCGETKVSAKHYRNYRGEKRIYRGDNLIYRGDILIYRGGKMPRFGGRLGPEKHPRSCVKGVLTHENAKMHRY